jgi:hypothetical protein
MIRSAIATFIALIALSGSTLAQKGTIRGSVIDNTTGEALIGVSVLIKDTYKGASTDLDGKFTLDVEAGTHALQVSYISYQTTVIEGVVVKAGEVTVMPDIRLSDATLQLEAAVVSVEATRSSESAIMTMKKKSATMMDGISSSNIKLVGDATAVEAAKRVTGVSIEGGKYVYVRGLGDRYTKVMLNNVDIPGLDPDKNSLQMDIFPTALIDNITVSKNFTADLPADFTGGVVNVVTKDFPEEKIFNVSFGTSFNPRMHFNSDYLSYEGGATDFLGFDDGTRSIPRAALNDVIPTPISGASSADVNEFVNSFNPTLGAERQTSLMDYSASVTAGNQFAAGKIDENGERANNRSIGYIASLTYRTEYRYFDDVFFGEYQRVSDPYENELIYANTLEGQMGEKSILLGALAGVAYKTQTSKLRLTAMHLQNGESRAGQFFVDNSPAAVGQSGYFAQSDNLEYNERGMTNLLLQGTHVFPDSNWEIDWRISPTLSTSEDPDIRKTAFTVRPDQVSFNAGAGGNPSRIWRNLSEFNNSSRLDFTKDYTFNDQSAKVKFGAMHTFRTRDYEILFYDIQFFGLQSWDINSTANDVLAPENIFPTATNNIYYQSGNNDPNPNAYSSTVNNTAAYVSNEFNPLKSLKLVLGLRAENFVQRHTGRDQLWSNGDTINGNNLDNAKVLDALDFFPSLNVIYAITENQNLRASATRTIARPSFKELSFAQILDPVTNRFFNGSLFEYAAWNGQLIETRIQNYDLRWEIFGTLNQLFSVSAFYKVFDSPIEMVRIPEQQTSAEFQPRNVGAAGLIGAEIELRKNLEFLSPKLADFGINLNFTYVESYVDMTDVEYNSRLTFERIGETIPRQRQMAGQAPYVINAGLTYGNFENGINAGLFYNVKGETLTIVGTGLIPDVYTDPFHSLNFSFSKSIGEKQNTTIDFRVNNILNDNIDLYYRSFEAERQAFTRMTPGRAFSIGVSHAF